MALTLKNPDTVIATCAVCGLGSGDLLSLSQHIIAEHNGTAAARSVEAMLSRLADAIGFACGQGLVSEFLGVNALKVRKS